MSSRGIGTWCCLVVLCFLSVSCRDFSSLSFKKLPIIENNQHLKRDDGEVYGMMKELTFNGATSLFVGGRSAIYKFDIHDLSKKAKTTNKKDGIWNFTPLYNRTYVSGNRRVNVAEWKDVLSTIDSCLSFVDRQRMNWTVFDEAAMDKVFHNFPGAGMRFMNDGQWIRFRKQFEDFVCKGAFIRGLEKIKLANGSEVLWACGSFGSFPKAFYVDPESLAILNSDVDSTLPTCARWPDEPMVTKVGENGDLFIGSGWGLYKPFPGEEHTKKEKSVMLYSDWKMLTSGHHWFTRMAMLLGRDVVFLPRVFESRNHYFFIGHEVTPSLSYVNALTREVPQSFLLRICKNDTGFKYTAEEDVAEIRKWRDLSKLVDFYTYDEGFNLTYDQLYFSYSSAAYDDVYQVPTKHFVSAQKFPFGCYLKRYDGAQSLNRFWGEQNIVYFNRLADADFSKNWVDERGNEFQQYLKDEILKGFPDDWLLNQLKYITDYIFNPNTDVWNPMVAAFSSPGFWQRRRWRQKRQQQRTGEVRPKGAICQFQVTEWKTDANERQRDPPPPDSLYFMEFDDDGRGSYKNFRETRTKNKRQFAFSYLEMFQRVGALPNITVQRAAQEFIALYGTQVDNFFSRVNHWFQGGQIPDFWGLDLHATPNFTAEHARAHEAAMKAGQCLNSEQTKRLTKEEFLSRMKTASTAWPTEWDSTATKFFDAVYHMNPMQVAGDNASFVYDGVEFAKMFVTRWNYTDYYGGNLTSPLVYVLLVTTEAEVFRVAMCDIASIPIKDVTCEMKHTDQPYVTRMFQYMRRNHVYEKDDPVVHDPSDPRLSHQRSVRDSKFKQFRVSSLLSIWRAGTKADEQIYPHDEDWQAPLLKDAKIDAKGEMLTLLTSKRVMRLNVTLAAVCGAYSACIHCASDPMCTWDNEQRTCRTYKDFKDGLQDVLNRGYACKKFASKVNETFRVKQRDGAIRLRCDNWQFFRGSIQWFYKGTRIDLMNSLHRAQFVISEHDNSLVVLATHLPDVGKEEDGAEFTCVGVSMDDGEKMELAAYHEVPGTSKKCDSCFQCNEKNEVLANFKACKQGMKCT